jgi:hypothetical protein
MKAIGILTKLRRRIIFGPETSRKEIILNITVTEIKYVGISVIFSVTARYSTAFLFTTAWEIGPSA